MNEDRCTHCQGFFARFRCNKPLECDCPQCQGYCECHVHPPTALESSVDAAAEWSIDAQMAARADLKD